MHQQFERVVERRRVRTFRPDDAAKLRLQLRFAGAHPGAIAGNGIDLAVVGEEAKRLRQPPVGHGVGRVALVKYSQAALTRLVAQIQIEVGKPRPGHQALVDDGVARARRQVHPHACLGALSLCSAACEVQAVLQVVRVEAGAVHEPLPDAGHGLLGALAEAVRVHRDGPPVDQR